MKVKIIFNISESYKKNSKFVNGWLHYQNMLYLCSRITNKNDDNYEKECDFDGTGRGSDNDQLRQ